MAFYLIFKKETPFVVLHMFKKKKKVQVAPLSLVISFDLKKHFMSLAEVSVISLLLTSL